MIKLLRRSMLLLSLIVMTLFATDPLQATAQLSNEQQNAFNNYILYFNTEDQVVCGNNPDNVGNDGSAVDRFLQVLAHQESGGRPTAHAPGSSAAGKYQYLTSTWHGSAKQNYPPADQFATADVAPEAIQDALAKIEYTKKFKQFNNDIFKLAISHFYPAANSNPDMLDARIGSNTITPRQYANSIIAKINSGVGNNIRLYYSEAPDFGTYYGQALGALPSAQNTAPSAVATGCGTNAITGECGTHALNVPEGGSGVNVCYFNQSDLKGGVDPNGKAYSWPGCGCLPTSSLMIQATMDKKPQLSNVDVLAGLVAKGGVLKDDGCSGVIGGALSYFRDTLKYDVQTIMPRGNAVTDDILQKIKDKLGQGYLIMTHTADTVDSAGKTGTDGHFLVLHAVDAQGNFYVANPGARADNGKAISPARIKTWLNEFYAIKKP